MNLGRWGLGIAAAGIAAAVVLGVLDDVGVGVSEPPPPSEDLQQRIIDVFETHEEWYLLYGRWGDLTVALAFAGLLVAIPFVEGVARARHVLVAGASIAVVGDLVDVSQLVGIEVARFGLDNDLMANFTAGNIFRFGIDRTSTYIWVGGLIITGVGMLILSRESSGVRWKTVSGLLGVSLIVTGLADISGNGQFFEIAQYAMGALALAWIVYAFPRTATAIGETAA
jgi:hypothetical protein